MLRLLRPLSPLHRVPPAVVTAGAALAVALLGALDQAFGTRVALSVLYPVPVAVAAWGAGRASGLLVAATAVASWFLADLGLGPGFAFSAVALAHLAGHGVVCVVVALTVSALARTVASLEEALARARTAARHDPLTGLVNARTFGAIVAAEVNRASRTGSALTLAYLDADGFKQVNDTRGHGEGDRVLRAVADVARGVLRRTDTVARLGGDEFAILMPETTRDEAVVALAKVRHALAAAMAAGGWRVTFSAGAVVAGAVGTPAGTWPSPEALVAAADQAMFTAKRAGGDRVWFAPVAPGVQGELFARG